MTGKHDVISCKKQVPEGADIFDQTALDFRVSDVRVSNPAKFPGLCATDKEGADCFDPFFSHNTGNIRCLSLCYLFVCGCLMALFEFS